MLDEGSRRSRRGVTRKGRVDCGLDRRVGAHSVAEGVLERDRRLDDDDRRERAELTADLPVDEVAGRGHIDPRTTRVVEHLRQSRSRESSRGVAQAHREGLARSNRSREVDVVVDGRASERDAVGQSHVGRIGGTRYRVDRDRTARCQIVRGDRHFSDDTVGICDGLLNSRSRGNRNRRTRSRKTRDTDRPESRLASLRRIVRVGRDGGAGEDRATHLRSAGTAGLAPPVERSVDEHGAVMDSEARVTAERVVVDVDRTVRRKSAVGVGRRIVEGHTIHEARDRIVLDIEGGSRGRRSETTEVRGHVDTRAARRRRIAFTADTAADERVADDGHPVVIATHADAPS